MHKAVMTSLAALGATLALSGCGSSPAPVNLGAPSSPAAPATAPVVDASAVVAALKLRQNGNAYTFTADNGQRCNVAVVLTSAAQVKLYANAGDNVATNPAGTAGVKIADPEGAKCRTLITSALAHFPG